MKQEFIELAKTLSHISLYNIEEIATFLEVNFKLISERLIEGNTEEDYDKKRKELISEKERLSTKRSLLENQVFEAKKSHNLDYQSFNRLSYAFRITKQQLVSINDQLTVLNQNQKEARIKKSISDDRKMLFYFIKREKESMSPEDWENYIPNLIEHLNNVIELSANGCDYQFKKAYK